MSARTGGRSPSLIPLLFCFPPPFSGSQICWQMETWIHDNRDERVFCPVLVLSVYETPPPRTVRALEAKKKLPLPVHFSPKYNQLACDGRTRQKLGRPRNRTGVSSVVGIQEEPQRSVLTTRLVTLCACCWTQVVGELPVFVWTGAGLCVVRVGLGCSRAPLGGFSCRSGSSDGCSLQIE